MVYGLNWNCSLQPRIPKGLICGMQECNYLNHCGFLLVSALAARSSVNSLSRDTCPQSCAWATFTARLNSCVCSCVSLHTMARSRSTCLPHLKPLSSSEVFMLGGGRWCSQCPQCRQHHAKEVLAPQIPMHLDHPSHVTAH